MTMQPTARLAAAGVMATMLVSGAANTFATKVLFTTHLHIDGDRVEFAKPWFLVFVMFFAMFCAGFRDWVDFTWEGLRELRKCGRSSTGGTSHGWKAVMVLPTAALDLGEMILVYMAMVYIPTSLVQMLRGACIIFTAIFASLVLGQRMTRQRWMGITTCVLGVAMVGMAGLLDRASLDIRVGPMVVGMALVMLSQAFGASHTVGQELIMKDLNMKPTIVVSWSGLWGMLIMVAVVFPLVYMLPGNDDGHQEDVFESLSMLVKSPKLWLMVLGWIATSATYNWAILATTVLTSGTTYRLIEAGQTVLLWSTGLLVHYAFDPKAAYGEVWTPWCSLRLPGFFLLLAGQIIYGGGCSACAEWSSRQAEWEAEAECDPADPAEPLVDAEAATPPDEAIVKAW